MEKLIDNYYIIVSLLLACADIIICFRAFSHKDKLGKYIGLVSIFAAIFCSLVFKNFNAGIAQKIKKNTKNMNVILPKPA